MVAGTVVGVYLEVIASFAERYLLLDDFVLGVIDLYREAVLLGADVPVKTDAADFRVGGKLAVEEQPSVAREENSRVELARVGA